MSKSPLASTKSALVFAAMIIFSTLVMVGPGGGVLDRTMQRFGQQASEPAPEEAPIVEQEQPKPASEPLDPDAGWGGTGEAVFGDYGSEAATASETLPEDDSAEPSSPANPAFGQRQVRRASALPPATGGPVKADSLGELVPRGSGGGDEDEPVSEAVVTARSISIQPQ